MWRAVLILDDDTESERVDCRDCDTAGNSPLFPEMVTLLARQLTPRFRQPMVFPTRPILGLHDVQKKHPPGTGRLGVKALSSEDVQGTHASAYVYRSYFPPWA